MYSYNAAQNQPASVPGPANRNVLRDLRNWGGERASDSRWKRVPGSWANTGKAPGLGHILNNLTPQVD